MKIANHRFWSLLTIGLAAMFIIMIKHDMDESAAAKVAAERHERDRVKAAAEIARAKASLDTSAYSSNTHNLFADPSQVHQALSKIGLGNLSTWKGDGMGWIAGTRYFEFDQPANNGLKNNLSVYMTGDTGKKVGRVKLILNINNPQQAESARKRFLKVANSTLSATGVDIQALADIERMEPFSKVYGTAKVTIKSLPARIENYELWVESMK